MENSKLKKYRDDLINLLEEKGSLTKTDIRNLFPTVPKNAETQFLEVFNEVKKEFREGTTGHSSLDDTSKRNLKKLIKRGFDWDDFKNASHAMYINEWAQKTGNDNPTHLLREQNFERYLNLHNQWREEEKKRKKQKEERQKIEVENGKASEQDKQRQFEKESIRIYNESLLKGEWIGTPYNASTVLQFLEIDIDKDRLKEIEQKAQRHQLSGVYKMFNGMIANTVKKDLLVCEAVRMKIKIKEK